MRRKPAGCWGTTGATAAAAINRSLLGGDGEQAKKSEEWRGRDDGEEMGTRQLATAPTLYESIPPVPSFTQIRTNKLSPVPFPFRGALHPLLFVSNSWSASRTVQPYLPFDPCSSLSLSFLPIAPISIPPEYSKKAMTFRYRLLRFVLT